MEQVLGAISSFFPGADGVTITGGEPFEQPEALGELLVEIRNQLSSAADVLVYSGFSYSHIRGYVDEWTGLIDALITEPFEIDQPQTRALMGSDNQKLHMLTARGRAHFASFDRPRDKRDDNLDFMFDAEGRTWLAGLPKRGDLERLRVVVG